MSRLGVNLCALCPLHFLFAFRTLFNFHSRHSGGVNYQTIKLSNYQAAKLQTHQIRTLIHPNNVCNLFHCAMISSISRIGLSGCCCSTFFVLMPC